MSDASSERAALLEQLAGYLAWESELGGSFLPAQSAAAPARSAGAVVAEGRAVAPPEAVTAAPAPVPLAPQAEARGAAASPPLVEPAAPRTQVAAPVTAPPASEPGRPAAEGADLRRRLALIDDQVRACTRCELHKGRTQTVFARGNPEARLVFVGEGPGQEEDRTGQPFVGPAGQLLDRMVAAMGLGREDVYICNVVKCRPPGNRTPLPSEAGACAPFLNGQLELIQPRVIVALGRCAAENMGLVAGGGWRGRWGKYRDYDVMPTYHPAFLLRSPEFKRPVWEDLQRVMAKLRETP